MPQQPCSKWRCDFSSFVCCAGTWCQMSLMNILVSCKACFVWAPTRHPLREWLGSWGCWVHSNAPHSAILDLLCQIDKKSITNREKVRWDNSEVHIVDTAGVTSELTIRPEWIETTFFVWAIGGAFVLNRTVFVHSTTFKQNFFCPLDIFKRSTFQCLQEMLFIFHQRPCSCRWIWGSVMLMRGSASGLPLAAVLNTISFIGRFLSEDVQLTDRIRAAH